VKVLAALLHLLIFGEEINLEIGLKILLTGLGYFFSLSTPMEVKIIFIDWQRKGKTSSALPGVSVGILIIVST
jgi:hypothetical protein